MRKALLAQILAVTFMAAALASLKFEADRVSSAAADSVSKFAGLTGLSFLFVAFVLFMAASVYICVKLAPLKALVAALTILAVGAVAGQALSTLAGMDNWTMMFVVPPFICLFAGLLCLVVSIVRLVSKAMRRNHSTQSSP